jgi:hypothetical protein
VIATQAQDAFGLLPMQRDDIGHRAGDILAPVDDVAEKDEHVAFGIARDYLNEMIELRATPVYIADDEGFHSPLRSFNSDSGLRVRFLNALH